MRDVEVMLLTLLSDLGIVKKLLNINATMISAGRKDAALNPDEQRTLQSLRESLESSKPVAAPGLDLVIKIITRWPYSDRLAALDLLRCMAESPLVVAYSQPEQGSVLKVAIHSSTSSDDGQPPNENSVMMMVRFIANLFTTEQGRKLVDSDAESAVGFLERVIGINGEEPIGKFNRNLLTALVTAIINYAVLSSRSKSSNLGPSMQTRILKIAGKVLREQDDPEVLYRGLVALGTLLHFSKVDGKTEGASSWIKTAVEKAPNEGRIKDVGAECLSSLK
jgi:phospholipase A-2-activating protein